MALKLEMSFQGVAFLFPKLVVVPHFLKTVIWVLHFGLPNVLKL